MKIKSIVLSMIFLGVTTSVKADPLNFIFNVFGGQRSAPVYYDNQYRCQESRAQFQQRDSFNHKVIKVDTWNGTVRRTAPPPDAYVYVPYPGPAPKHLYNDKSIRVRCRGDMHYIIYRKPGW
jgi:hypothetical protein